MQLPGALVLLLPAFGWLALCRALDECFDSADCASDDGARDRTDTGFGCASYSANRGTGADPAHELSEESVVVVGGGVMTTAVLFQALPPLSPDEYRDLERDILDHGVLVPIVVDEHDVVIDGHHRQKIAKHHGLPCPSEVKAGFTDTEKRSMALSLNINRRQLTREQRRALVAESIKSDPQLSDREHGRRTGVSDKTAGAVRSELESTAEIPQFDKTVGADGKARPASKPKPFAPQRDTITIDRETGEVLDHAPQERPADEPAASRRRPITDTARDLGLDIAKLAKRIENFRAGYSLPVRAPRGSTTWALALGL